jgi:hypothetical protein
VGADRGERACLPVRLQFRSPFRSAGAWDTSPSLPHLVYLEEVLPSRRSTRWPSHDLFCSSSTSSPRHLSGHRQHFLRASPPVRSWVWRQPSGLTSLNIRCCRLPWAVPSYLAYAQEAEAGCKQAEASLKREAGPAYPALPHPLPRASRRPMTCSLCLASVRTSPTPSGLLSRKRCVLSPGTSKPISAAV